MHSVLLYRFDSAKLEKIISLSGILERLDVNLANNRVTTQALGANAQGLNAAVFSRHANVLKIRTENTTSDTGDLGTNALEVLRTTTGCHMVTNDGAFAANFTNTRHVYTF